MNTAKLNSCRVCNLHTTNEFNFLLNCCLCKRGFHHRCCEPPIQDEVLTSLIKASLKNKPGKGVKFWKCNDCRELQSPTPAQPSRVLSVPGTSGSKLKQKQIEVIVISDDDESLPNKEIVVAGRPPARHRDPQPETRLALATLPESIRHPVSRKHEAVPTLERRVDEMEVDRHLEKEPPKPSTSRFGLLSPPVSITESFARYTSVTPFHLEDRPRHHVHNLGPQAGPSNSKNMTDTDMDLDLQPLAFAPAPHSGFPPTPASTRADSPIIQAEQERQERTPCAGPAPSTAHPSANQAWATNAVEQSLRILSNEFRDATLKDASIPTRRSASASSAKKKGKGRAQFVRQKPRKPSVVKELNWPERTLSQFAYFHFGTP